MSFNPLKKLTFFILLASTVFLQHCGGDSTPVIKPGAAGFFVVNEGAFGGGNASVSFYDRKTDALTNNVFSAKNGRPLGDQGQSMTVFNGKGYIVVQNSSKIEVINADDYSSVGTISGGLPSPRYFLGISSTKAYVSDWGADGVTGTVKVVDLNANSVIKTIPTGKGSNRMLRFNNLVYVTNAGGYDTDNTVTIIDTNTDAVTGSITTGDNPNSIVRDKSDNLWVASAGVLYFNPDFSINVNTSTKGSISKISPINNMEVLRFTVDKLTYSAPANLDISPDGSTLYFTYDDAIYSMAVTSLSLPPNAFKSKSYYGLAVDPFNGNVIGCNAPSFSAAGSIDIYTAGGALSKTLDVGIGPNGCAFK